MDQRQNAGARHVTIRRREFIGIAGGAAAWPLAVRAQQKAMPVIGFLNPGRKLYFVNASMAAFHQGLSEAGYVEGQNLAIEYRFAEGDYDRLPALATDLVNRNVNLIVTAATPSTRAAKNATSTIPIIFMGIGDPVGNGLVASLARPDGNLTGFSDLNTALNPKRLELLNELVPQAGVIAVLMNPNQPFGRVVQDMQEAARSKGIHLPILKAGTEGEIDAAFTTLAELNPGALFVVGDVLFFSQRERLVALASRQAIPAIYFAREFVIAGGLISYGIKYIAVWHQLGVYAGRILNGAKSADLPIQQPTNFELAINLKTAKTLGLIVPPSLLARADEVIE